MKNILPILALILLFGFFNGCKKDTGDSPDPVGNPKIIPTFSIQSNNGTNETVLVKLSWTSENAIKGTLDGLSIQIPIGDTTFLMKKGETKNFTFVVENTNGKKVQEYLKVSVPTDPSVPTLSVSFTCEGETIDTLGVPPVEGWPIVAKVIFTGGTLNFNGCDYANSPKEFNLTITETKTYDFKVTGPGGDITESVTIVVSQPVPPTQDEAYLCGPWQKIKVEFQDAVGFPWRESDIWECMKDDIMTFYFPSKTWVYDNGENRCSYDEPRTYSGNWFITGTVINTGGANEKITLNPDTLVWVYETIGNVRETFIRPPVYKK
jgi:hypothetical protein